MLKWSECEAFSPGGIAGCRPHRHLLLSLPYISRESAEQRITTCFTDGKWDTQLQMQVCVVGVWVCTCMHMFSLFFSVFMHYVCMHDHASVCAQVQETPYLMRRWGLAQRRQCWLPQRVFISQHHLYAAAHSYDLLQPKPISHRVPA